MSHWTKQYTEAEQRLFAIRARLARLAYHRWQFERMEALDVHLSGLAAARADHEALCRIYAEARDHHRAARLKLRRHYYALLRVAAWQPSEAPGIEAKVNTLAAEHPQSEPVKTLTQHLQRCQTASTEEGRAAKELHETHQQLRRSMMEALSFVEESIAAANCANDESSLH